MKVKKKKEIQLSLFILYLFNFFVVLLLTMMISWPTIITYYYECTGKKSGYQPISYRLPQFDRYYDQK